MCSYHMSFSYSAWNSKKMSNEVSRDNNESYLNTEQHLNSKFTEKNTEIPYMLQEAEADVFINQNEFSQVQIRVNWMIMSIASNVPLDNIAIVS